MNVTDHSALEEMIKNPIERVLIAHERRIQVLETYVKIGVGMASATTIILSGILATLLLRL